MVQLSIVKIILVVLISIIIISLLKFLFGIHPLPFRTAETPASYGFSYENVSFSTDDGITIKGWLLKSKTAQGTVIVGHGYPFDKGNIFPIVTFLYPEYNLMLYDHRYFGESEGRITTVGAHEAKDVQAAVNYVKKRFGPQERVALYGFSLSASAMLMSNTSVSAIVADSPYANLDAMIKQAYLIFGPLKYPFVFLTTTYSKLFLGITPKLVSPALAIKNSNVPILLIHGDKDSQIPVENSYAIKEANPDVELWVVTDADHIQSYRVAGQEYQQKIKSFLQKHMKD